MIAQVSSLDEHQALVVDARAMNEGDGWAGSGSNPWRLDSGTSSILFLTDESGSPVRIGLDVTAGGVHYYLIRLTLAPHETRAIDLRALRDSQVPDFKGDKIPAGAAYGSVNWVRMDSVPVEGRMMVIQQQQGMASSYDCASCPCPAGFSALNAAPDLFSLPPGGYDDIFGTGTYYDCNRYQFYYDVTYSTTFSSSNTSVIKMDSSVHNKADAIAAGTSTITETVVACTMYDTDPDLPCPCTSQRTFYASIAGTVAPPSLVCGATSGQQSAVARGSTARCTINNLPTGSTISNWKFTDGTNTVTTSSATSSWSGTAVQSGTVSVTVTLNGSGTPLSAALTVNARTNFAFTAVSAVKESNGGGTGACSGGLPVLGSPPTATSGDIGQSCLGNEWSYNFTQVSDSGPNNGYRYTTSASYSSTSGVAAAYQWERVPDLDNTSSTFYQKQTGTYNASTNPSGCISGSNLATQTQRHEVGLASSNYIESHWVEYKTALSSSANNFGTIIEGRVGPPSESQSTFTSGLNTALSNANTNIDNAFAVEPYGADHNEYDVFLGYIDYAPNYNTCQ